MSGEEMRDENRDEMREENRDENRGEDSGEAGGSVVRDERASAGEGPGGVATGGEGASAGGPEGPPGEPAGEEAVGEAGGAEGPSGEKPASKAEKRVDEGWKAEAKREKEELERKIKEKMRKEAEARKPPPADFLHFVSGIAAQVLMQLGELENPIAGKKVVDLSSARYSIDILQMLEEKTRGNLTPDETRYLTAALHDLRMRFVGAASGQQQPPRHGPHGAAGGTESGEEAGPC